MRGAGRSRRRILRCADSSRFSRDASSRVRFPPLLIEEGPGVAMTTLNLLAAVVPTTATACSAYAGDSRVRTGPSRTAFGARRHAEGSSTRSKPAMGDEGRCGHSVRGCLVRASGLPTEAHGSFKGRPTFACNRERRLVRPAAVHPLHHSRHCSQPGGVTGPTYTACTAALAPATASSGCRPGHTYRQTWHVTRSSLTSTAAGAVSAVECAYALLAVGRFENLPHRLRLLAMPPPHTPMQKLGLVERRERT